MKRIKIANMISNYEVAKESKVGARIHCPGCGRELVKKSYQHKFHGTKCKDRYWNTIDSRKRNNTTRISPASAAWMLVQGEKLEFEYEEHPFSSAGHGQWDD